MHCYDASSVVGVRHQLESCLLNHVGECRLLRELSYAFNEVLVRILVVSQQLAHHWNCIETILIIELLKQWNLHLRKLEAHEPSATPQDSVRLFQCLVTIRHVSDSEGDGIKVVRVALE